MSLFSTDALAERRDRAASAIEGAADLVLVTAGEPLQIPGGLDQQYRFVPHPEYYWLSGSRRSGGAMAWTPDDGWTPFVRPVTAEERLWEGDPEAPEGRDVAELEDWLKACGASPERTALLGAGATGTVQVEGTAACRDGARQRLDVVRRHKDAEEIGLLRRAARATAAGHARAREVIAPGVDERSIQIELEAETFRHGADAMGYESIVGVGANSAVLHFAPGRRRAEEGELVLIDAGGAVAGYTSDVTRTYPVGRTFTERQQAIFDLVSRSLRECSDLCRPGIEWHDVHRRAAEILASGLVELGILRGSVDGLLESEAIALFFPHGIGHMVGLGVRDVGGHAPDREPGRKCCGARVRVDLPLEAGFVMTVEPGLYFVPAILDDPERRQRFADAVDWTALEPWRDVGGVRLEDNLVVTEAEPEILTASIPLS
ncbi:MAG: M24 family metallopeptidase [Acidobacteria bacterium]|nr:MAG: M24 family metallopeptidase [Acidobacteriota bacterium]